MKANISTEEGMLEVEVVRVFEYEGRVGFVHETAYGGYKADDWETGWAMTPDKDSPEEAIAQAKARAAKAGPEKMKAKIDAAKARSGIANQGKPEVTE